MKVTQTIQLQDDEILAIQKVLALCDEISGIAYCSMKDVFEYLVETANVIGDHKYSIGDTLQITEIG